MCIQLRREGAKANLQNAWGSRRQRGAKSRIEGRYDRFLIHKA